MEEVEQEYRMSFLTKIGLIAQFLLGALVGFQLPVSFVVIKFLYFLGPLMLLYFLGPHIIAVIISNKIGEKPHPTYSKIQAIVFLGGIATGLPFGLTYYNFFQSGA